jgi:hypothetical protein
MELWATPPNVDIASLCRAHHVPFQRVERSAQLLPALEAAWTLRTPSVVEVITDRTTNVTAHKALQATCAQAAWQALATLLPLNIHSSPQGPTRHLKYQPVQSSMLRACDVRQHFADLSVRRL